MRHSQHPERCLPFDLHVLGLPLAFILSQDQTLHCKLSNYTQLIHKIYIPASLSFFLRLLFFRLTSLQRTCVAAFGNTVRKTASQPRFPRFFIFVFSVPSEQECKGSRSFSVCKKNLKKMFFLFLPAFPDPNTPRCLATSFHSAFQFPPRRLRRLGVQISGDYFRIQ